ncbi:hypothetical protein OG576_30635 [Streptomyces sp. NBC_01500]|nr:hypothetical protein [Streptomyces sp. NBC_01500]
MTELVTQPCIRPFDIDDDAGVVLGDGDPGLGRTGVLDRVGQQFGDGEGQGGLDRRVQAELKVCADSRFDRAVQGKSANGVDEPAIVQHGRVDSLDQFAELGQ